MNGGTYVERERAFVIMIDDVGHVRFVRFLFIHRDARGNLGLRLNSER